MRFTIEQAPHDDVILYQKSRIELKPGLTVLVGANGAGKTTLIRMLEKHCEKREIPYFSHDERRQDLRGNIGMMMNIDPQMLAALMTASEGESVRYNVAHNVAGRIGRFVLRENASAEKVFIFMDAVDSGLSADNIVELKQDLFGTILKEKGNRNQEVYIVVSANTYTMVEGEQCFDVQEGKYIRFSSFEEYKEFVLESKRKRDNASRVEDAEEE